MGVTIHNGTMDGAVTPICNECGVMLCWDIDVGEYQDAEQFWDDWICQDCNGGVRLSFKAWKEQHGK